MIDTSALQPGFGTLRRDGFFAELHPDGRLASFGSYDQGRPRGWVLTLAADGRSARVEKTTVAQFPDEGEGGPPDDPEVRQAFFEQLDDWARTWIHQIYEDAEHKVRCSFCSKASDEVTRLIAGPSSYICNECVAVCSEIIASSSGSPA